MTMPGKTLSLRRAAIQQRRHAVHDALDRAKGDGACADFRIGNDFSLSTPMFDVVVAFDGRYDLWDFRAGRMTLRVELETPRLIWAGGDITPKSLILAGRVSSALAGVMVVDGPVHDTFEGGYPDIAASPLVPEGTFVVGPTEHTVLTPEAYEELARHLRAGGRLEPGFDGAGRLVESSFVSGGSLPRTPQFTLQYARLRERDGNPIADDALAAAGFERTGLGIQRRRDPLAQRPHPPERDPADGEEDR